MLQKNKFKIFCIVSIVLLIVALYFGCLSWLFFVDLRRGDYNYGYLIPLISGYLIWEKRKQLKSIPSAPSWKGIILVFLGIVLFWFGELAGEFYSQYVSLWLIIVGLVWCFIGWKKIKIIFFSLIILLFMFPLPQFITNRLTLKLKLISSELSVLFLHFLNIPAYREGNIIDLGFTKLQVADACSGLRYFFPLLVMGIIMVYFYREKLWKKIIIVISTIPLSIITNSFRIAITAILYGRFGQKVAEGFLHEFSGWVIFIFNILLIMAEMWFLKNIIPLKIPETQESQKPVENSNIKIKEQKIIPLSFCILFLVIFSINVCIKFSLKLSQNQIPIKKQLSTFPLVIDGWRGKHEFLTQNLIKALDLSDYVIINYENKKGKVINFYVAYYESQTKGKSIHPPRTCLTGSGWVLKEDSTIALSLPNKSKIVVRRLYMEKMGSRQLCYYWFYIRGRVISDAYHLKLYNFIDSIIRHRTDGALIRVITPVYEYEDVKDADIRLKKFIKRIYPVLLGYLPS